VHRDDGAQKHYPHFFKKIRENQWILGKFQSL
jgi:hypothetical protein